MIRLRRERDERGAVAIVVAVFSLVMVLIAAFAVDLGVQRVARRDMQSLADIVALDLARELDGRTVGDLNPLMAGLAKASVQRNEGAIGEEPALKVELGRLDPNGDFVKLTAATDVPSAVRVEAATSVGFAFVPGRGAAVRSAVADVAGGACFSIGSYAARLDAGASPILGDLLKALGADVNLSVGDYNGLANADVDLLTLVGVNLGAGTLEELVKGDQLIGLGSYYLAVAEALGAGAEHAATVGLLQAMALEVQDLQVHAGDLLGLDTGGAAGLDAGLNVLDLVTAAAAAATTENAVVVPRVGVNLGPVANVQSSLSIIEAPRPGCGRKNSERATAKSTQINLNLSAAALDLNLGLLDTRVSLSGTVGGATAIGKLTDVRCQPEGITVKVSDGLLTVDITLEIRIRAILGLLPAITGPIRITGTAPTSGDAVINIVDGDYTKGAKIGGGSSGIPVLHADTSGLRALGLPLGAALQWILDPLVSGLVNPLIQGLDKVLLAPLLNSLGLDASGADVFAMPTPKCDQPALRG